MIKYIFCLSLILLMVRMEAQTLREENNVPVNSKLKLYQYPRICPVSNEYKLKADGKDVFVYHTSAAPFAAFTCEGEVSIEIEIPPTAKKVSISPKRLKITPEVNGNKVFFKIPKAMNLVLELDGMPQFYVYANPPETNVPDVSSPNVKFYKAGQVYEVGRLELHDNDILYIEGGAVVRGCVRATSAKNVRICGYGILDGGYYTKGAESHRSIVMENCKNSSIEDLIMIEPTSWMIVLGLCEDVKVVRVKQLGSLSSTDGVDVVGSKRVTIEDCILRNGDDCVVIKSLKLEKKDVTMDYTHDVEDIMVRGCTFVAYLGGTALEIGHELRTASVRNISFIDCDILGVHGFGGVFGIHNADRAIISNILYENIRVEHHYNKLIDLKVIKSMWGKDSERGGVRDVVFKNIDVDLTIFNPGYSMSLIGGYDDQHKISNVIFDNFKVQGVKVTNADQLDLYIKQATGIKFK